MVWHDEILEKDKTRKMVSVPFNKEEYEELQKFKEITGQKQDATALKIALSTAKMYYMPLKKAGFKVRIYKQKYKSEDFHAA